VEKQHSVVLPFVQSLFWTCWCYSTDDSKGHGLEAWRPTALIYEAHEGERPCFAFAWYFDDTPTWPTGPSLVPSALMEFYTAVQSYECASPMPLAHDMKIARFDGNFQNQRGHMCMCMLVDEVQLLENVLGEVSLDAAFLGRWLSICLVRQLQ
jgi:hypothetical protein